VVGSVTLLLVGFGLFAVMEVIEAKNNQQRISKVIFTDHDVALFASMKKIGKYYHNNDLNILFYTLSQYVENLESYPKHNNQYSAHVQKLQSLQRFSSQKALNYIKETFQSDYTKKLENGGFVRVSIQNVNFDVENKSFFEKIHDFLLPQNIPTKARVTMLIYVFNGKDLKKQTKTAEISFSFDKIQKQKNGEFNKIKFFVQDYRIL
jgi:type IV secretory pathway component VirB8